MPQGWGSIPRTRTLACGLALCATLVVCAAPTEASPRPLVYVALGDSIARGWGMGGPVPGAKQDSCGNALPLPAPPFDLSRWDSPARAYPTRLARLLESQGVKVDFDNRACSGETTEEALGRDSARLDEARGADVVTVDIGADDILWSCGIWRAAWKFIVGVARPVTVTSLLSREARSLHTQLFGACSSAKVTAGLASVARGLPRILAELTSHTKAVVFVATYYNSTGAAADGAVVRRLNRVIDHAVAAAGRRVHLVSGLAAAFASHDCRAAGARSWMVVWDICLHPNDAGQQAIARLFDDQVLRFLPSRGH
jgi:lysophospholipase L1-like esterase